ncbi:hypothetical protein K525DRAFT_258719 [Schizophyllum commune Loenen D]|nr:hypothetical protein K525DRAFT_258719 [Schizophyllum commune Loenen D]
MSAYRLPPELWTIIFEYACNDTGATGRSISQTCVHFHDIARRVRLRCVSVTGAYQIRAFEAHLQSLPPDERQVRHIFVSSCPQAKSRDAPIAHAHVCRMPGSEGYAATLAAYRRIFALVAPTLRTCYVSHCISRYSYMLPCSMPHLTSLVMNGPQPTWYAPTAERFPALRYLGFAGFSDYRPESIDDLWNIAPNLEHIDLEIKYPSRHLVTDLRAIVRRRSCDVKSSRRRRLRLEDDTLRAMGSSVRVVSIQVGDRPPQADLALCHMHVLQAVQQLSKEDPRLVVKEPKACIHHTDTELDWLENY